MSAVCNAARSVGECAARCMSIPPARLMPQRRYAFTQARKSSLGSKSARRDPEACILRYGESASEESIRKMRHVDAYHLELKYSPSLANRRSLLSQRGDVVLI